MPGLYVRNAQKMLKGNEIKSIVCSVILVFCGIPVIQTNGQSEHTWPYLFPCRIQDSPNNDLMVMMLGDVETTIDDGNRNN